MHSYSLAVSHLSWMIQRLRENIDAIFNLSELKPISAELLLDKQVSKTPGILNCTLKVYTQLYTYDSSNFNIGHHQGVAEFGAKLSIKQSI